VTIGTDGTHHVKVERHFFCPTTIGEWIVGAARLIDFLKAAVCRCAGREAELCTVNGQVGFSVGVVESIHNGDSLSFASAGGREVIRGL
jgi:hypothetical protein